MDMIFESIFWFITAKFNFKLYPGCPELKNDALNLNDKVGTSCLFLTKT